MAKKTRFACSSCGYESGKWYGKCPDCGSWNTFTEVQVQESKKSPSVIDLTSSSEPTAIGKIETSEKSRVSTGFSEFDRVLGGGIVPGSAILLSGDPGVGKSTILLSLASNFTQSLASADPTFAKARAGKPADRTAGPAAGFPASARSRASRARVSGALPPASPAMNYKVLYVSGEESESQVKLRAERLGVKEDSELYILSTGDIDQAVAAAEKLIPNLLIVDSIQTMASGEFPGFAGSLPQIRHATGRLVSYGKKNNIPVFIVGHVTKEGSVAGPMLLSHMVDCVLYLEGENISGTRILRAFKNRFGDASEVGIFTMEENGLTEIDDSRYFVGESSRVPGSCLTVVMEGSRPIICEIQSLVVPTNLSFARRVANGISEKRLELLLAVIQKHAKLPLDRFDIFVNVVGGLKITETASDLAVALACISSYKNRALGPTVAIGELGLLGELKDVVNIKSRIKEAKKLGFKNVISAENYKYLVEVIKKL